MNALDRKKNYTELGSRGMPQRAEQKTTAKSYSLQRPKTTEKPLAPVYVVGFATGSRTLVSFREQREQSGFCAAPTLQRFLLFSLAISGTERND